MSKEKEKEKGFGLKNRDLYRIRQGFESLAQAEAGAEFSFKIIKNLRIIEEEIKIFEEMLKPSEDYSKKYQPKVEETAKKFCIKDKNGAPIPRVAPNGSPMFDFEPENKNKFDKEIEALEKQKEFAPLVEARKKQVEKYNEIMEKDAEVALIKIPMRILPAKITPQQLNLIFEIVEE